PHLSAMKASLDCLVVLNRIAYPPEKTRLVLVHRSPGGLDDDTIGRFFRRQPDAVLGYSDLYHVAGGPGRPVVRQYPRSPAARDRVLAEFLEAGRGGKPFRCEYRILTSDGRTRWLRDHAVLVADPSGPGQIVQGVVLDITDQVEAEQSAAAARGESEAKSR